MPWAAPCSASAPAGCARPGRRPRRASTTAGPAAGADLGSLCRAVPPARRPGPLPAAGLASKLACGQRAVRRRGVRQPLQPVPVGCRVARRLRRSDAVRPANAARPAAAPARVRRAAVSSRGPATPSAVRPARATTGTPSTVANGSTAGRVAWHRARVRAPGRRQLDRGRATAAAPAPAAARRSRARRAGASTAAACRRGRVDALRRRRVLAQPARRSRPRAAGRRRRPATSTSSQKSFSACR